MIGMREWVIPKFKFKSFTTGVNSSIVIGGYSLVIHNPSYHMYKVCDEGRDDAFENSCVSSQNEFIVDSTLVGLQNRCGKDQRDSIRI